MKFAVVGGYFISALVFALSHIFVAGSGQQPLLDSFAFYGMCFCCAVGTVLALALYGESRARASAAQTIRIRH